MKITVGTKTYDSIKTATSVYGVTVSKLSEYIHIVDDPIRLQRVLTLEQLKQILTNPSVDNNSADQMFNLMLNQLANTPIAPKKTEYHAPQPVRHQVVRKYAPAYGYDTAVTLPETVVDAATDYIDARGWTQHDFTEIVIKWAYTHLNDVKKYYDPAWNVNPAHLKFPMSTHSKEIFTTDRQALNSRKNTPYIRAAIIVYLHAYE